VRIAVVGGGLAGALLAWRLCRAAPHTEIDVHTARHPDASGASGGLVRGFDESPDACRSAAESIAELCGDNTLRAASGYREVGSVYLLPPGVDRSASIRIVADLVPGSVSVLTGAYPFLGLRPGTTVVAERRAGYLSPALLRAAVLGWLADGGATIRSVPVTHVGSTLRLADGRTTGYDAVVVAAGARTPALLAASGLATDGLRTKQIQYAVYPGRLPGLGAFLDGETGLYGRPYGDDGFLLGLPSDRWDVDPTGVRLDRELVARTTEQARCLLGVPATDRLNRTVVSADCYRDPPGLALREVVAGVFTFTGGSGGAAKTVLAASRTAAALLVR
jgi:glycine/D-amino acid oxidase-like deaminating enzyme